MPNPARRYHDKLLFATVHALYPTKSVPHDLRRRLQRSFTSSTIQQDLPESEPQIAIRRRVLVRSYISGNQQSPDSHTASKEQQIAIRRGVLIRKYKSDGQQSLDLHTTIKEPQVAAYRYVSGTRQSPYPIVRTFLSDSPQPLGLHTTAEALDSASTSSRQSGEIQAQRGQVSRDGAWARRAKTSPKGIKQRGAQIPFPILRYGVSSNGRRNVSTGTRRKFRKIGWNTPSESGTSNVSTGAEHLTPVDPSKEMADLARFDLKRHDQAITERFLGVKRVTKHEIVGNALRVAREYMPLKSDHAIQKKKFDLQKIDTQSQDTNRSAHHQEDVVAWNHDTKSSDHHANGVDRLQEDEAPVVRPFDLLDAIGSELQIYAIDNFVDPALGGNGDSKHDGAHDGEENEEARSKELLNIDWNDLPLSPLMDQRLIDARTKFRRIKPSRGNAPGYDEQKGLELSNDYLATMLASPVRACRLSFARLPSDFLLATQTIQHPETGQVWELPQGLDPQDTTMDLPSDTLISPDIPGPQLASEAEVQPISLLESARNPSSTSEKQNVLLQANNSSVSNKVASYMLSSQAAVQMVSELVPTQYARTIPARWRSKLGFKLASQIHWRKDMPDFIHALMQRQITDQLRVLNPLHGGKIVQACVTLDESGRPVIKQLPNLKERAIVYFGQQDHSVTQDTSFYSIANAIADGQAAKVKVLDNLLTTWRSVEVYSHLVTIQKEDGESVLVFDMTRLLDPKFAQSLLAAGYDQPAYLIDNNPESRILRTRLWSLAHFLEQKGIA